MRHDGVDQSIEVPEISVRVYERSGWEVVDEALGGDAQTVDGEQPTELSQAEDGDQAAAAAPAVGPVAVTKTSTAKSRRREGDS